MITRKQCPLHTTGELHIGIRRGYGSMHKFHARSSQTKHQRGEGKWTPSPNPSRGAISNGCLLGKRVQFSLRVWPLVDLTQKLGLMGEKIEDIALGE